MKTSILILAAGLGTRMKSQNPKVLQKISSKPMILHILKQAYKISDDVCIVLSHQKEKVEQVVREHFPHTRFLEQDLQNYPGTAGALRGYESKYDKVLILCGDMPLVKSSDLEKIAFNENDFSVAVFEAKDPKSYGRIVLKEEKIEKIVETKDASKEELAIKACNSGVYAIKAQILKEVLPLIKNDNKAKEYYLTDAVFLAKEKGYVVNAVFVDEQNFMGVNDKIELSLAQDIMQEEIKKEWMKQGVIFHMPATTFISDEVEFIGECEVYENVRIEGKSKIINSIIKSSSVIEDSIVKNSDIGPLAHLRPKCHLKNTHIGNFVECKNALLNGVKAGHLSYLGDCEIDEGSNIGCGSITCNYDGVKKHKTKIGKNVFVGSDTQFIAPVNVEDDVIIAAGSTVYKDVKKGSLYINRAKAEIKEDFFYHKLGKK
ncbi:bifunctional UDP-N-acetylglucosamine diphosphorylase/glucosamine-1-phosphate N-acetyltransferase GlmU [Campylobacter volucris]|uniref:Bifunctional protein GlmU n=1 Tax=Campylobacter volucris TaxID=1031542 RepID=A0AAE6CYT6_9BACT|nr:bifunctional UDP-N-acetylglucosamine diphosphorylase/glucosamine-1-phosphate N-acetyltransferase GlmU [Campylobacter volucris]AJC94259.1 fused N-acetylglucosamine-1-phosphate uridyltransferase and glucosamine-1-phosphate acetyltransferase [Campylobacter volucris LMG 24379]KAB0580414.1 bifunctional UDP-N-acetylglucosamine diphosphorylase/glucosamine-1-phosphate N-acetyltransferase GlmU [Campylobacter volucris]QBL13374.1 bifunctional N-acetylglucosamine-1-phosphate uridyltransferase/glucosamine